MRTVDTPAPEPVCAEAEQALLGACLLAPARAHGLLAGLSTGHFTEGRNLAVYQAITSVLGDGGDPDPVAVLVRMRRINYATGGRVFGDDPAVVLADLMQACPAPATAADYRRLVEEYAGRRTLIEAAARLDRAARVAEPDTLQAVVAQTIIALTPYAAGRANQPAAGRRESWDERAAA